MTSLHPLHESHQVHKRFSARLVGSAACVFGYPLVEMLRMCRVQTYARYEQCDVDRTAIDVMRHSASLPTARHLRQGSDEEGQRYTTAWVWLGRGARFIAAPWAKPATMAYCFSFYDAFSEHIADVDHHGAREAGILLVGPQTTHLRDGIDFHTIQSPTHLVWLVGRFQSQRGDLTETKRLQSTMRISGPVGTLTGQRPAAVELWEGDTTDSFVDLLERARPADALAPAFYANLCRTVIHLPPRDDDRQIREMLASVGLAPNAALNWKALDPEVRIGLIMGFEDAARAVKAHADTVPISGPSQENSHLARAAAVYRGIEI